MCFNEYFLMITTCSAIKYKPKEQQINYFKTKEQCTKRNKNSVREGYYDV